MFNEKAGLGEKSYFLSNPDCFFHRYADTCFKNKWTGFWVGEQKLLEFVAFKVGEEFLSEKNIVSFNYDYSKAIHFHVIGNRQIEQKVWIPKEKPVLLVELSSPREINAEMLLALNFRKRTENFHSRQYSVKMEKNALRVDSNNQRLFLLPLNCEFSFSEAPRYETHYPAGEKQCYFCPGKIQLKGKTISLMLSPLDLNVDYKKPLLKEKESHMASFASFLKSNSKELEQFFNFSALSIELLRSSKSYYAGLPWFSQHWARDVFWSLPAITELGLFDFSKQSLLFFAGHSRDGRIPNFVNGEKNFNSIDATPLFVLALCNFISYSADKKFLGKTLLRAMQSIAFLEENIADNSLIVHDLNANETWMDSIKRNDSAIEVQALALKAFESFSEMLSMAGMGESRGLNKRINVFRQFFPSVFSFGNGLFADRIEGTKKDPTKRINVLVPMLLGQIKSSEQFTLFESAEFSAKKGITSISMNDSRFNANSYHEGSVWSLGNAWLSAAAFALGDKEKGFSLLKSHCSDFWENALGCIGETWNPLNGQLTGCGLQLWASAMTIRIIDELMLGIKANAFENHISLNPRIPREITSVKRKMRLGKKEFVLSIERRNGKINAKASNKKIKIDVLQE